MRLQTLFVMAITGALLALPAAQAQNRSIDLNWVAPASFPSGYTLYDYCVNGGLIQGQELAVNPNPPPTFYPQCGTHVAAGITTLQITPNFGTYYYLVNTEEHLASPGTGTVSVSNGSANITSISGSGFPLDGSWNGLPIGLDSNGALIVNTSGTALGGLYTVASVTNSTHLVLSHTYAAASGTISYAIDQIIASPPSNEIGVTFGANIGYTSYQDFGTQNTGTNTDLVLGITNTVQPGGAGLAIGNLTVSGSGFTLLSTTCGPPIITPGGRCTVTVRFHPTTSGKLTGALTISDNVSPGTHVASLVGIGVGAPPPVATLTPGTIPFGNQTIQVASSPQQFTFTNVSGSSLTITGISLSDTTNYVLGPNTLPAVVANSGTFSIPVTFNPQTTGSKPATVTVTYTGGSGSPLTSSLSGTGIPPTPAATIAPGSIAFGNQIVPTQSNSQQFTFTNVSTGTITITGISVSDPANYTLVNLTCAINQPIARNTPCAIPVAFKPQSTGLKNATVTVTYTGGFGSPLSTSVSGTGVPAPPPIPPTLTPASSTFVDRLVFTTSGSQTLTFTNGSGAPITISGIQLAGSNPGDFFLGVGSCAPGGMSDSFNQGTLDTTRWFIDSGNSPASSNNTGTFNPANVDLSSGMLRLELDQSVAGPLATSVGAEIRSKLLFGFGSYTWVARGGSQSSTPGGVGSAVSGQVTGLFNFINNSQTEIDFEYEGNQPTNLEMSNFSGVANGHETSTTVAGADQNFHNYTFNWQAGQITYSVDGTLASTHTTFIPTTPAAGMVNFWGTNSINFGGTATAGTRYLFVSGFSFVPATLATVANNSTCSIPISFAPKTAGAKTATISVSFTGGSGSPLSAAVSGTGLASPPAPNPTLTPMAVNYGNITTGTVTNPPQSFTFTNSTGSALAITGIAVGDATNYLLGTDNCPRSPATFANAQSCAIPVAFRPQSLGSKPSTLTVSYTGGLGSQVSTLAGSGVAPPPPTVTINPPSKAFGNVKAGQVSAEQTFTWSNGIGSTLNIGQCSIVGANPGDFTRLHDNCSNTAVGSSGNCTIGAEFSPLVSESGGAKTAFLSCPDNAAGSPHTAALSGTSKAPHVHVSPNPKNFSSVLVGSQSDQVFTVTNDGDADAAFSAVAMVTGTNFLVAANNCNTIVPAGMTCNFTGRFKPLAIGSLADSARITDDAFDSPQFVPLTGTGGVGPVSLAPASINFGQAIAGFSVSAPAVFSAGSSPVAISSVSTSTNFGQTNNCGLLISAFQQCGFTLFFNPTAVQGYSGNVTINYDDVISSSVGIEASATNWQTCVLPGCNPGGVGPPTAVSQTFGSTSTVSVSGPAFTNALWLYKIAGSGANSATKFATDFTACLDANSGTAEALEYDFGQFVSGTEYMWGTQCNQANHLWQVFDQLNGVWVDTAAACSLSANACHHIQEGGHRSGSNMIYDYINIDGTPLTGFPLTEPAGSTAFADGITLHFQLDIGASGTTLSEGLQQINFLALAADGSSPLVAPLSGIGVASPPPASVPSGMTGMSGMSGNAAIQ
ncbi:MAG: choice-of-anchor D domain-containing protein [Terriglobales bacterium]